MRTPGSAFKIGCEMSLSLELFAPFGNVASRCVGSAFVGDAWYDVSASSEKVGSSIGFAIPGAPEIGSGVGTLPTIESRTGGDVMFGTCSPVSGSLRTRLNERRRLGALTGKNGSADVPVENPVNDEKRSPYAIGAWYGSKSVAERGAGSFGVIALVSGGCVLRGNSSSFGFAPIGSGRRHGASQSSTS